MLGRHGQRHPEMIRTELKQGRAGGRTPFEVLDDFQWTGDSDDLIMWPEYADKEIGSEDLAVIHSDDWHRITQIPISPGIAEFPHAL